MMVICIGQVIVLLKILACDAQTQKTLEIYLMAIHGNSICCFLAKSYQLGGLDKT